MPEHEPITIEDYQPGEVQSVEMHDGSHVVLKKLDPEKHDPTDKLAAFRLLEEARLDKQFITGLIYVDQNRPVLAETSHLVETPLARLPDDQLRPSREVLDSLLEKLTCCKD